ncbi:GAF domain-containing sensor histidine kinase [Niveispirillum sp. SYP-B3756]|uniref:GAF domain-containing sensor histidine kinase n=1 Tax=Niveispirillum sp. SYP-B3756 TaxID=2662178 RepID=UPI00156796C3|nr:GAF domain-containing sensor histidine kinase [Niveispirillum sp. SYP-B3756]
MMKLPPVPEDEGERVASLHGYAILDTGPEDSFDRLARMAATLIGTPIALVSLVDETRQWFKARYGLEAPQTPREMAFCAHTILGTDIMEVEDALLDARFADNPLVTGAPDIRFYAGAPLLTPNGHRLGTLCVIDRQPRHLCDRDRQVLRDLAQTAMQLIELRHAGMQAVAELAARRKAEAESRQAQEQAEAALAARSLFLATMTHELRTPLTAVIGFSGLMAGEVMGPLGDPAYKEFVENIRSSGQHLLDLVNDMLDIARVEAGKLELCAATFDSQALVNQVVRLVRGLAFERKVTIELLPEGDWQLVQVDARAIKQVLLNLLSNAVKFTAAGGVVQISAHRRGRRLVLTVRDNGDGIAPADLARLGRPYEQAGDADSRSKGTGLGLALSHQLIHCHGGQLRLESELGRGTIASFDLPLAPYGSRPT